MYYCPTCRIPLRKISIPLGILWECPKCSGRIISVHVLRKLIPNDIVTKLWQRAKSGRYKSFRKCPVCKNDMPEIPIINNERTLCLDVCAKCFFVWFDTKEYESLPKLEISKDELEELPQEYKEAIAKYQLDILFAEKRKADEREQRIREERIRMLIDIAIRIIFS